MEELNKSAVTAKEARAFVEAHSAAELREKCTELIKDLRTLAARMQDIVDNNKVLASVMDLGIVVSVASCGEPDFTMGSGVSKGIVVAATSVALHVSEGLTGEKSDKSKEKDNG